ncbi:MAG TPA: copper-binding protein [Verrucomicrobiae bacterium]|nr:copper-binding protein [Verrucomicrobiae bacterium]
MKYLNPSCILLFSLSVLAAPTGSVQSTKSYSARGIVEQIAPDRRKVTIHHQAIPGYMMEMTMGFPVQNTNELNGISPGDKITFTLVVRENDDWVENIQRVGHSTEIMTNAMHMSHAMFPELKPGDLLPDGELLAEDGRHIHLSDFHGRAVALTFFFTRCPLPNYCPLMNRNFAATRELISAMPQAPTNWQFLSISFDPGFDTPETLENYANVYRGAAADRWLFAVASTNTLANLTPSLDLVIMRDGENIVSHSMRTVVLDPQGRIFRQLDGNKWTPQELADAMLEAARLPTQ